MNFEQKIQALDMSSFIADPKPVVYEEERNPPNRNDSAASISTLGLGSVSPPQGLRKNGKR